MEYQYYEFLAIDRPLSAEDIAYVRTLSRRVEPTSTSAAFNYSYGEFPGDPLKLLAKHYDVMLYLANWVQNSLRSASRVLLLIRQRSSRIIMESMRSS